MGRPGRALHHGRLPGPKCLLVYPSSCPQATASPGCAAARPSTSTTSSPFSESCQPPDLCPTWGRRRQLSTKWSSCSTAGRCAAAASHATWYGGGAMRRRTTSRCGWRSWRGTARISWRISTPPSHAAPAAAPLAGLPRSRPLLRPPHGAHAHGARATRGVAPVGFRLDIGLVAPTEVLSGPVLVGRAVLFRRGLGYGSRRGTVARPHPHAAVGPRVSRTSSGHAAYSPRSALGAAVVAGLAPRCRFAWPRGPGPVDAAQAQALPAGPDSDSRPARCGAAALLRFQVIGTTVMALMGVRTRRHGPGRAPGAGRTVREPNARGSLACTWLTGTEPSAIMVCECH